jgi:hypothetical protein
MSPCSSTCVWLSMRPGRHVKPERSMTLPAGVAPAPGRASVPGRTDTILSARTSMSVGPCVFPASPSHSPPQRSHVELTAGAGAGGVSAAAAGERRPPRPRRSAAISSAAAQRGPSARVATPGRRTRLDRQFEEKRSIVRSPLWPARGGCRAIISGAGGVLTLAPMGKGSSVRCSKTPGSSV